MPTILTHAAVPLALGVALGRRQLPPRLVLAGVLAAILPDLDAVGLRFGVPYADVAGHRGAFHSLAFATLLGVMAALASRGLGATRRVAGLFVGVSAASHGLLDMLTTGGLGVAWFWPWTSQRFFLPWHVIRVSPLSLHRFGDGRGLAVAGSEIRVVWLPACAVAGAAWSARRLARRPAGSEAGRAPVATDDRTGS